MSIVTDHNNAVYRVKWRMSGTNRYNGAFYYSKELVANIIPKIKTDRNWLTINTYGVDAYDHSIVFIHNNLHPENYKWLKRFRDLILVCGVPETMDKVADLGYPIYVPLSIDVGYLKRFERPKTKQVAFAGRYSKYQEALRAKSLPKRCDTLYALPRTKMLARMAEYKQVYAVGRTAIEAKVLGCEILPYDERFPDPKIWKVLDHKDAIKILQRELDKAERKIRKGA